MSTPNDASQNSIRPDDKTPWRLLAALLSSVRYLAGGDRFNNLYRAVVSEIQAIDGLSAAPIRLLDYGCGIMSFSKRMRNDGIVDSFIGMDIFVPPAQTNPDEGWQHYRQTPKTGLGSSAERFDLAIVLDVIHHTNEGERAIILRDLATLSRYVLVKEHFEYGQCSRQLLRLADWYGNYAYGVNVPDRYFDQASWQELVTQAGLKELKRTIGIRVHDGLFGWIIPPHYHFISVLTRLD